MLFASQAVACPDTDSDNKFRKDPPSSVMVQEIVALRPYTENTVDDSQAAVNGAVEISLGKLGRLYPIRHSYCTTQSSHTICSLNRPGILLE